MDREVAGGGAGGALAPPIFWHIATVWRHHDVIITTRCTPNNFLPATSLPLLLPFSFYYNCSVHVIYVPPPKYFKKISADEILVWKVARSLNIRDFHLYTWIPCYIQWLMRWINLFCPHNMGIIHLHTTFASNIQPITTIKIFKRNISMSSRPFKTVTLGEKRCRIVITKNLELSLCQSIYIHLYTSLYILKAPMKGFQNINKYISLYF